MPALLIALVTGLVFGLGLALSGLTDPAKVQGFLDIFGAWDSTLLFVLGGAVGFTLLAFRLVLRQARPLFAERFYAPSRSDIDRDLLLGSALFGVGWGLSGYCPGPAIASLAFPSAAVVVFVLAMLLGTVLHGWYERARQSARVSMAVQEG